MARHYHVGENTPGYLPEADPAIYDNLEDAVNGANFVLTELEGMGYKAGSRFESSDFETPGWLAGTITGLSVNLYQDEDDLGRVVFIHSCEDDCESDD